MHPSLIYRLFIRAVWAWWEDNALRLGASLAYYTLFAIAPVLLVAIAIAGLVFGAEAVRGEIVGQMRAMVGRDGAEAVQAMLEGASRRQSIWRVKPNPSINIAAFVTDRLRSFGIVIAIGFLLLVSLAVSAALAAVSNWMDRRAPGMPILWQIVNTIVSLGVVTSLFALLYKFLPDVRLQWRDVLTGAFVTALLFTIGKQAIGFYLGQSATASSYGAAGSVIVLLLWVYYSTQIVLLGAEFTRLYAEHERGRPQPQSFAEPDPEPPALRT